MSKYTTELRFICENFAGLDESVGYNDVEQVIANSRSQIFNFDYPIFDESYRSVLETKILKHFYTREICEETVGLWRLRLNTRMNEIMPYYNTLYEAWAKDFDVLHDVDVTTEHTLDREGEQSASGTNRNMYSDTPQGSLQNVENEEYLTNASKDTSESTGSMTSTDNYLEKITGKRGSMTYPEMLESLRQNLINIDLLVIDDLNSLFMQIW